MPGCVWMEGVRAGRTILNVLCDIGDGVEALAKRPRVVPWNPTGAHAREMYAQIVDTGLECARGVLGGVETPMHASPDTLACVLLGLGAMRVSNPSLDGLLLPIAIIQRVDEYTRSEAWHASLRNVPGIAGDWRWRVYLLRTILSA